MKITYDSVKDAVQMLIDKGLDPTEAQDFMRIAYGLNMGWSWENVSQRLQVKHAKLYQEVERMHRLGARSTETERSEQLEMDLKGGN